jgi:hypothetical protein
MVVVVGLSHQLGKELDIVQCLASALLILNLGPVVFDVEQEGEQHVAVHGRQWNGTMHAAKLPKRVHSNGGHEEPTAIDNLELRPVCQ